MESGASVANMERDCWWKNTDNAKIVQEIAQLDPTLSAIECLPTLPTASIALGFNTKTSKSPPTKRHENRGSSRLDCAQDSERQEAEVNHLSRTNGYIGAAGSAAPRTFAAHCPFKQRRQLTLPSATGQTPADPPSRCSWEEERSFILLDAIIGTGRLLLSVSELADRDTSTMFRATGRCIICKKTRKTCAVQRENGVFWLLVKSKKKRIFSRNLVTIGSRQPQRCAC